MLDLLLGVFFNSETFLSLAYVPDFFFGSYFSSFADLQNTLLLAKANFTVQLLFVFAISYLFYVGAKQKQSSAMFKVITLGGSKILSFAYMSALAFCLYVYAW